MHGQRGSVVAAQRPPDAAKVQGTSPYTYFVPSYRFAENATVLA
jgi:hypothetical protein